MECSICIEKITDNHYYLPCTHVFHSSCITQWINDKPYCPLCKLPIIVNDVESLNLYNTRKTKYDDLMTRKSILYQKINDNNESDNLTEINKELEDILDYEYMYNDEYFSNRSNNNTDLLYMIFSMINSRNYLS